MLAVLLWGACAFLPPNHIVNQRSTAFVAGPRRTTTVLAVEDGEAADDGVAPAPAPPAPPAAPAKFDLKGEAREAGKKGAGFNQFDPVLSVTSFISRRFGLAGGLAVVVLLASTEGNEILKSLGDNGPQPGSGIVTTTSTGLSYKDILVGTSGDQVGIMGSIVGIKAKVAIADKVLYDTAGDKPIAFRYGKRPFENVLCDGVEQGVKGMKVGGVRELTVPADLAPKGLAEQLKAAGVPLSYTIEVTEVLPGYF